MIARASHPQQPASVKPAYKLGKRNVPDKTYAQEPARKQGALRPCAEFWRSTGSAPRLLFPQVPLLTNISPQKEKTLERDVALRSSDTINQTIFTGCVVIED